MENLDRQTEQVASSAVPMNAEELKGQGFKGTVVSVAVVREYPMVNGALDQSNGKQLYVKCALKTDFMKEPNAVFNWNWKVSDSTQGVHAAVLDALSKVELVNKDGKPTGKRGIKLKDVKDLEGQVFDFERKTLKLGSFEKKDFPIPVRYYIP